MNSLLQAISDLSLILIITLVFSVFLLGSGWYIDHRALKRQLKHIIRPERDQYQFQWRNNFLQGLGTEFIGAAMTAFLFGIILLIFQQYQSIENDKADLILQMRSPDNSFAIEALRVVQQKGWETDGTLVAADLGEANLERANLSYANLAGVDLSYANLEGTNLEGTNLEGANLVGANLKGANLSYANLLGASLGGANLERAGLWKVNLEGAYLQYAYLVGASLREANLEGAYLAHVNLEGADLGGANLENVIWALDISNKSLVILPDGTYWASDTNMVKFTDSEHFEYKLTLEKINTIREDKGLWFINPETGMQVLYTNPTPARDRKR